MKAGPIFAMIGMLALGVWLVAQPSLESGRRIDPDAHRYRITIGARELTVEQRAADAIGYEYHFVGRDDLEARGWIDANAYQAVIEAEAEAWESRPSFSRSLLGFFNITSWVNCAWFAIGLAGQIAFFGRMLIQWVVSEKQRQSVVPEIFWWFSFFGGVSLFTYFVWRTDFVGVLGQSTGIVIYARNLRLIRKKRRRDRRRQSEAEAQREANDPSPGSQPSAERLGSAKEGSSHASAT